MIKKVGSRLRKKLAAKQRNAKYGKALERIATEPNLQALCINDGAFFLRPLFTIGFLIQTSPHGKDELGRDDQIAHDEICEQSRAELGADNPLGRVSCTLQQTKVLAFLFRYFAENIPSKEKEKRLKEARELGVEQSTLVPKKYYEEDLEDALEIEKDPFLKIATALEGLVTEGEPAVFWFDKGLLPEAKRKVYEAKLKSNELARFLFSGTDQDWAQMLEQDGHSKRKIEKALNSKRQNYLKFIERRKKEDDR